MHDLQKLSIAFLYEGLRMVTFRALDSLSLYPVVNFGLNPSGGPGRHCEFLGESSSFVQPVDRAF